MRIRNFEFKAKVTDLSILEEALLQLNPVFRGTDHQIDTYFNVPTGRLKLREGTFENALINYHREDVADSKRSDILLYQHEPDPVLKQILTVQLAVKVVVDKYRKIYFVDHVKFHLDTVIKLGTFLEVEVIDADEAFSDAELKAQCDYYFNFFGLDASCLIDQSYSDLLLHHNP